jgi:hypothetical protein
MDGKRIVYGYIPLVLGILVIAASICALVRSFSLAQVFFTLPVAGGVGMAVVMLGYMLSGPAYPSYVPHILIGLILPVAVGQLLLAFRRKGRG